MINVGESVRVTIRVDSTGNIHVHTFDMRTVKGEVIIARLKTLGVAVGTSKMTASCQAAWRKQLLIGT